MAAAAAAAMKPGEQRPAWPLNPFPQGPVAGKTTERVLAELRRVYPSSLNQSALIDRLNSTRGAVGWALAYLAERGKIEAIQRTDRPPYCRYRAAPQGDRDDN